MRASISICATALVMGGTATSSQETMESTPHPHLISALWDGSCFYPKPDAIDFNLTAYLGRWYQVAGTFAPFTAGCSCIFAEYSLNENGTVNVFNACQRGQEASNITGTATPANKAYGGGGVFVVQFPFGSTNECQGPNYIVQDYSYDGQWAIVQASNFSTLFLLSRQQNPSENLIEEWLQRAERRGSNIDEIIRINQTGCLFTYE